MSNRFFCFDSHNYLTTLAVESRIWREALNHNDWNENKRNITMKLMFNEYPKDLSFPVEFDVSENKKLRDVIEGRSVSEFLISNNLRQIFESAGLTGWKSYDVVIFRKDGAIVDGYCGFTVTGKNEIDPNNPDFVPDFFRLSPNKLWIICSQKVVDTLKQNKIKDFDIEAIQEGHYMFDSIVFKK